MHFFFLFALQLDAIGRPDESLLMEFVGPLKPVGDGDSEEGRMFSLSLQKGQLRANVCFRPLNSANLEVSRNIVKMRGKRTPISRFLFALNIFYL